MHVINIQLIIIISINQVGDALSLVELNSEAWGKLKKDVTKTDSEIVDPDDKVSSGAEDAVSNFSCEFEQSVKCISDREKEQQVMEEAVGSNELVSLYCMLVSKVKMSEIVLRTGETGTRS